MALSKPIIPWDTRLGTVGESEIKARLALFSIPTKYETDPGLDFYCELIENDSPSIPFYVQAKGTRHFDNSWGVSIQKSTIVYWLQQVHPVFLIVYDEKNKECYWKSIEDDRYILFNKMFTTDSKTIYIKVTDSNFLKQDKNIQFVDKVRIDSDSIQLFRGRPQFIGAGYVKSVPPPPRTNHELKQIKENIRASMYSLIPFYIKNRELETARNCGEFLEKFDKSHYNHFVWLGFIYKVLGRTKDALKSYEMALKICKRDKIWPSDHMSNIIVSIENEIKNL